jgi:hypothetical protein
MKEKIKYFLDIYLPKLTKHECDFAVHILSWDDETKIAFKLAKDIFEERLNDVTYLD